jgi:DNA-binding GntR family transcriptional regulator
MQKEKLDQYFAINPFETLGNIVFNLFVEEIASCNLMPGTKLNISKIADDLNISRTPVREALNRLSEIGFIKIYKKGYYVSEVTSKDITKIYFIRSALESKAAFLCAQLKNFSELEQLKKINDDFMSDVRDFDHLITLDSQFHTILISSCGNEYLMECYRLLQNKFTRLQRQNLKVVAEKNKTINAGKIAAEHNAIINSIQLNMPELAEKEMQNHLNSGLAHALLFTDAT